MTPTHPLAAVLILMAALAAPSAALDFPGPDPGAASARLEGGRLVLENAAIAVAWTVADGDLRLDRVEDRIGGKQFKLGSEAFAAGSLKCDLKLKDFLPQGVDDRRRQEVAALVAVLNHELMGRFRTSAFQRTTPGGNVWGMSGRVELITRRHL